METALTVFAALPLPLLFFALFYCVGRWAFVGHDKLDNHLGGILMAIIAMLVIAWGAWGVNYLANL